MVHCSRPLVLRCGPQQPCISLAFTRRLHSVAPLLWLVLSVPVVSTKRASRARIAAAGGPRVTCGRSGSYRSGPGVLIDTDTTMFVGIGACSGGIRSCGWFSRISSPPWQSPNGLHQDQSSCDAAGCAIGSRSAARALHRTYSQQAPSLPRPMACAEAVRAAMSSPLTSSAPSCMWCT